jgi:uncharacterized protein (TIGR04222 family)
MASNAEGTWGIPGPLFVILYLGAIVIAVAVTLLLRYGLTRGRQPRRPLDAYETAYLAGGERQLLATALTALRGAGVIGLNAERIRLTAGPRDRCALDQAIIHSVPRHPINRADDLLALPAVAREVAAIRDGLAEDGLVLDAGARARWHLGAFPLWSVLGLGLARLAAGYGAGKPVAYLAGALVLAAGLTALMALAYSPVTRAGKELLEERRKEHHHLDPDQSPAWNTYGSDAAVLGAALFGAGALFSIDPAYAKALALETKIDLAMGNGTHSGGGAGGAGGCGG